MKKLSTIAVLCFAAAIVCGCPETPSGDQSAQPEPVTSGQSVPSAGVASAPSTDTAPVTPAAPESAPTGEVTVLDEAGFYAAVAEGVVLVDFWATWCGPCRTQAPIVEEVAQEVKDIAKVAKLDVDEVPAVAKKFKIRAIPTLIVFKDGKPSKQFVGVTQAEDLIAAIKDAQ